MTIKQRYVFQDNKFVPAPPDKARKKSLVGDEMIGGVEHPADGRVYYSRSEYKKVTKAHGLEECYGEPDKYWQKEDTSEQDSQELEQDILEAFARLEYGEGLTEEELELCRQKNEAIQWEQEKD